MNTEVVHGIEYKKPYVTLLNDTGLGIPEMAARTCYDSFQNTENESIREADYQLSSFIGQDHYDESYKDNVNGIEHSDLLDDLAWTYFHHSILEHTNISYLIRGTSRSVLQEHARHRIQGISVRSTRYTMSNVINAYVASKRNEHWFTKTILDMDMFVTADEELNRLDVINMFNKFKYQESLLGEDEFIRISIAKSSLPFLDEDLSSDELFIKLQNGKSKRNVGDAFKGHIVTDTWKVDMVVTMNLRALKNYFDLRDSGAAYFQIQWLAKAMKEITPVKYLKLIDKKYK